MNNIQKYNIKIQAVPGRNGKAAGSEILKVCNGGPEFLQICSRTGVSERQRDPAENVLNSGTLPGQVWQLHREQQTAGKQMYAWRETAGANKNGLIRTIIAKFA